ncbi:hypothetical protein PBRA_008284 [Plasmodiophora brassicae]|uniref:Isopenicillin N synthase-like Fe(2+) 2OG dioxygenase domain-containing protein n=1 Tax=Plasmodiophora brassicae TaxID=37360 RepID=A0A0G4J0D2_PLABS|nr:hypothetical protein PBRA_008284 [Plasmodiophora brassicae]
MSRALDVVIPVVDIQPFLSGGDGQSLSDACKEVARSLQQYGVIIIKDPRVTEADNDVFVDMMERYYEQPNEFKEDERPELHYQVGVTPSTKERARDHCQRFRNDANMDMPVTVCPPGADPKWRYFWRVGERPAETSFASLNAEQVVPARFPEWPSVMDRWGSLMLDAVKATARMAAIGFGLPDDTFASYLEFGPHLLAPTGSDLSRHNAIGTAFASVHYDLNFLTIHGRSRFPGLFIWLRDGRRVMVRVPPNCLLLQAGKQFEWLTGGEVLAGFHEVVVCDATLDAVAAAKYALASLRSALRLTRLQVRRALTLESVLDVI